MADTPVEKTPIPQQIGDAMLQDGRISSNEYKAMGAENGWDTSPKTMGMVAPETPPPTMTIPETTISNLSPPPTMTIPETTISNPPAPSLAMQIPETTISNPPAPSPTMQMSEQVISSPVVPPSPSPAAVPMAAPTPMPTQVNTNFDGPNAPPATSSTAPPTVQLPTQVVSKVPEPTRGADPSRFNTQERVGNLIDQKGVAEQTSATEQAKQTDLAKLASDTATTYQQAAEKDQAQTHVEMQRLDDISKQRMAALDDMNQKIDPSRVWSSKTVAEKILAVISLAIGGAASGYTGGKVPNGAMEMLKKQIDNDIQAQQANAAQGGKRSEAMGGVMRDTQAMMGDRRSADAAARITMLEAAKRQGEAIGANYAPGEEKNRLAAFTTQIDAQISGEKQNLYTYQYQKNLAQAQAARAEAIRVDEQNWKRSQEVNKNTVEQQKVDVDKDKNNVEREKANGAGSPKEKERADDHSLAAQLQSASSQFDTMANNLPTRIPGTSVSVPLTGTRNPLGQSGTQYTGAQAAIIKILKSAGDNSEPDADRLRSMTPQPGDSPATLQQKKDALVAIIYQNHPAAAARNPNSTNTPVQTTDHP